MTKLLKNSRRGFTAVELVVVIVVLVIVVTVTMVTVDKRRQARLRLESRINLSGLWVVLAGEDTHDWMRLGPHPLLPPLSTVPGQLAPQLNPEMLKTLEGLEDEATFVSPAHPDAERKRRVALADPAASINDESYWYLGYIIHSEEMGLAFVEAYKKAVMETGKPPTGNVIKVRPYDRGDGVMLDELFRLGKQVGSDYPRRYSSPILIERPGLQRGGSTVLYEAGMPYFRRYPRDWLMTEKFIKALESLDELKVRN